MSISLVDVPPLVSFHDLCVSRGGRPVLSGVSAALARGQTTALVGLNGSGKSTLLRTILGEFPYTGRIEYRCGHDHSRPRPEYVGYVPQKLNLDPRLPLTVRDLVGVATGRKPWFLGKSKRFDGVVKRLEQVGVADRLDTPVDGLSGGQLQRVLLALALEPSPELLLLDEPAAGIDYESQEGFYELIAHLSRDAQVAVLIVSHDLAIVSRFAHQVLCLRDGRITFAGAPDVVLDQMGLQRA